MVLRWSLWIDMWVYVSYQPAPRLKLLRHKYYVSSRFVFTCVPKSTSDWFNDAWLLTQKKRKEKKPWEKLVLKCHEDPFQAAVHRPPALSQYHLLQYTRDVCLTCWMFIFLYVEMISSAPSVRTDAAAGTECYQHLFSNFFNTSCHVLYICKS